MATASEILQAVRALAGGRFLREPDVATIAADPQTRLTPLLVRCERCRFTAPAQDVAHIIASLKRAGDAVRDVSIPARRGPVPADDPRYGAGWNLYRPASN